MHLHIAIYLTDLNIRRMNNIETPVENISRKKLTAQKTSLAKKNPATRHSP